MQGALTSDEYKDAMGNAAFTYDIAPEQLQITADPKPCARKRPSWRCLTDDRRNSYCRVS
jgi:hypothetical protein